MAIVYGFEDIGMHAMMLLDAERMRAFSEAIAQCVRPGEIVVDVGAGTGILSLLCAKAGARRVYSIERGPMAMLIADSVRENGFGDVITVLRMDSRDAKFDEPPTLIVSETLGAFGIDEDCVESLGEVRARCAPGCRAIPSAVSLYASLAEIPALAHEIDFLGSSLGVKLGAVRSHLVQRPAIAHVGGATLLGPSECAIRLEPGDAVPPVIATSTRCTRNGDANAIVAWFEAELAPGVSLSSSPHAPVTHWGQIIFPIDPPLKVTAGSTGYAEIRPRVISQRHTYAWSARCGDDVRTGDAMMSMVGDDNDIKEQLGAE